MPSKTFKIGEVCQGGIITVEIKGNVVSLIGKEWDMSQGTKRSSNQTKAKEFTRLDLFTTDSQFHNKAEMFLSELATSYWASQIIDWVNTKVKIEKSFFW